MNARTFSGSFFPGDASTPEETSTPQGDSTLIASVTFSGVNPPAKFQVKASGGELTAVVTAAADSHAFFGIPSTTSSPIQLVQEFEIVPGDPHDPRVMLSFTGTLDGYVRSEKHSAAALRQADAAVYPVDGGPSISLGFTPCSASEGLSRK